VWVVGNAVGERRPAVIAHWDGSWVDRFWEGTLAGSEEQRLNTVWGSSADDVWALGMRWGGPEWAKISMHWDGAGGSRAASPTRVVRTPPPAPARTTCGSWRSGRGRALDGASWSSTKLAVGSDVPHLNAVWVNGPDDVWTAGTHLADGDGLLFHWDGSSWTQVPATTRGINGLWGSARDDVWAVGNQATMLHFAGQTWSAVPIPTTNTLTSVAASPATTSGPWAPRAPCCILTARAGRRSTAERATTSCRVGEPGGRPLGGGNHGTVLHRVP